MSRSAAVLGHGERNMKNIDLERRGWKLMGDEIVTNGRTPCTVTLASRYFSTLLEIMLLVFTNSLPY